MPRIAVTTTKEITIQLQIQVELTRPLFFHFVLLFAFFPFLFPKVNSRHAACDATLKPVATNSNRPRATPQSPTILSLSPSLSQAMCIRDEPRSAALRGVFKMH